jgi:hypothetical protein
MSDKTDETKDAIDETQRAADETPASAPPSAEAAPPVPSPKRLPYEKPAIVSEEAFETLALACGKFSGRLSCTFSSRS